MSALSLLGAVSSFDTSDSSDAGAAVATFIIMFILGAIVYIIYAFLLMRVFKKAGQEGWKAWVPIYNGWVLFEISGKPGWWVLFGLIPYLGSLILFVLTLLASLELAKRFGKGPLFGVFGLWIFSLIGYIILGFGDSKYQVAGIPSNDPNKTPEVFANNNNDTNPPQNPSNLVQ